VLEIIEKWREAAYSEVKIIKLRESYLTWSVSKCNKVK